MSKKLYFPIKHYFPLSGSSLPVFINHNDSSVTGIYNCDEDIVTVCAGSITTSHEMYSDFKNTLAEEIYNALISDGSLIKNNNNSYTFTRPVCDKSGLMASISVKQHVNGADSWRHNTESFHGHGSSMSLRKFQNYSNSIGLGRTPEERKVFFLKNKGIIVGTDEPEVMMYLRRSITEPILTQQKIKGYSVDALVKKLKTVIEYDERHHFTNNTWSIYNESDINRQRIIEAAGYNFFRIKQRDWNKDMKNEVERFKQYIINIGGKELCVE